MLKNEIGQKGKNVQKSASTVAGIIGGKERYKKYEIQLQKLNLIDI